MQSLYPLQRAGNKQKSAHPCIESKHSLRPLRGVIPNLGLMNSSNEGPIHGHTAKSHESSHSCFSGTCVVYTVCTDENGEPKIKKKGAATNFRSEGLICPPVSLGHVLCARSN